MAVVQHFSQMEMEYFRGLKRREREEVQKTLEPITKAQCQVEPLRFRVLRSRLPAAVKLRVFEEMRTCMSEKYVTWIHKLLRLPIGVAKLPARQNLSAQDALLAARAALDADVTGHEAAKQEVLKLVLQQHSLGYRQAVKQSYALGFEGVPGCGKTLFVKKALVPALGRPVVSIPLGGATDVSFLVGHPYTYEGAKEGALAAGLSESGCANPIFFFDEVDKISETERGREISSLLVHLIDPTANTALRDRYFHGLDLDYSFCTFVFSYNDPARVHPVLLDRIRRVPMSAPTFEERQKIISKHLLPRLQQRLSTKLGLSDAIVKDVADCDESGMRDTERVLEHVVSSALVQQVFEPDRFKEARIDDAFAKKLLPEKKRGASHPMYL